MSGSMRKIGEYLGLLEDTGRYDETTTSTRPRTTGGRRARAQEP